ncbi:hypothetical protein ABW11_01445 [Pluralibacter gergoviae]|uniref:hypothetical protein n=1 Tax=Pluralibacter gergoviae TaxID=61647 RepID=UPI000651B53B|nr:hypothetical protein [Pluralibacter gergoviae]EKW9969085.1 hypothetical protein [Pluralibacter gergoviae]KMK05746.1 hypothetical protein ABW07_19540 [Pluralibacter gergoviae]KMK19173.1 hypothetical protein ABW09_07270 [Pluralibacter gergoviae]KMK25958.1 hypothetical protein ABW10_04420 [Pluralibacter gergoviae]KMK30232.1 hypothetical protein ABW11_01445 [Pluralibacter gergoviae]
MSKKTVVINKSTQLFLDLAIRSLEANWKLFQGVNGDGDANDYLDNPDFMSPFIMHVIDHIQNNFERFTSQEGACGNINEVNFEQIAVVLVCHSERFRK